MCYKLKTFFFTLVILVINLSVYSQATYVSNRLKLVKAERYNSVLKSFAEIDLSNPSDLAKREINNCITNNDMVIKVWNSPFNYHEYVGICRKDKSNNQILNGRKFKNGAYDDLVFNNINWQIQCIDQEENYSIFSTQTESETYFLFYDFPYRFYYLSEKKFELEKNEPASLIVKLKKEETLGLNNKVTSTREYLKKTISFYKNTILFEDSIIQEPYQIISTKKFETNDLIGMEYDLENLNKSSKKLVYAKSKNILNKESHVYLTNEEAAYHYYGEEEQKSGTNFIKIDNDKLKELTELFADIKSLPSVNYIVEQTPAEFPGGLKEWAKFLERNLNTNLPMQNGAPPGKYTVRIAFSVLQDGTISDIIAENDPGYETKEEALRIMSISPKWKPATQNGRNVIFKQKQSISFVVGNDLNESL